MKLQKLLSLTRKAVDEFNLIDPGDKIAVGVSGGKDSLTMLYSVQGAECALSPGENRNRSHHFSGT